MPANKYVSQTPIHLHTELRTADFYRADITFFGVDHSGATFEGRVFLNNPDADESTPRTAENGYAGSFYIFGHGGCWGDEGHCAVPKTRRPYDIRPPHPLTPAKASVIITDALRRAIAQGPDISITVVPVVRAATDKCDLTNVFKFDHFEIFTYAK
jgi:hypothetical protein